MREKRNEEKMSNESTTIIMTKISEATSRKTQEIYSAAQLQSEEEDSPPHTPVHQRRQSSFDWENELGKKKPKEAELPSYMNFTWNL
jgi:hypothetical protein